MYAKKLLEKLESYEQKAYAGGYGSDWLEQVGEGFKFYVQECAEREVLVTLRGFERYIDRMAAAEEEET